MNGRALLAPVAALGLMAVGGARPPTPGPPPGRLVWPLASWVQTQGYGCTALALEPEAVWCRGGHFHSGLDLAAPPGTEGRAALSGVAHVVAGATGYGLHVVVGHGGGMETLYGHLEAATIEDGEPVDSGQRLGLVGSTGASTGPHLHFEVRRDGRPVDPLAWLAPAGCEETRRRTC